MELLDCDEWQSAAREAARARGTVLVLGDLDAGKTSFVRMAANEAVAAGRRVVVLDADLGQSEIGPPTCVGWALPAQPFEALLDLTPAGLAFVGSTSPRGRLAEYMVALGSAHRCIAAALPDLVLVDTMGFVHGPGALRLRSAEMQLLRPEHVVVLERAGECGAIARFARIALGARVRRLQVPGFMGRKPATIRAQRRAARFVRYFKHAQTRTLRFEDFAVAGGWLNSGTPLEPHLLKAIAVELGVAVLYAERAGKDLGIVVNALPGQGRTLEGLRELLRFESVTLSVAARLRHLVVGLSNGREMLGIGTVEYIDYRSRLLHVRTPVRDVETVRLVSFGRLRVTWDGRELGGLEPGEI